MFVNVSNHRSADWRPPQLQAARELAGEIVDLAFPDVPPEASEHDVESLAAQTCTEVLKLRPSAVMVQGDYTLTYCLVRMLTAQRVPCYSATTRRTTSVRHRPDGSAEKTSIFNFVRFRRYA